MQKHETLSRILTDRLGLANPPVAFKRVDAPPAGIDLWSDVVPSACTFWRRAEERLFFAAADVHEGCPIGKMVLGFELGEETKEKLMGLVGEMCSAGYIAMDEVGKIPKFDAGLEGVVYGPLAAFPLEPDAVLAWLTPRQTMILQEAVEETVWPSLSRGGVGGRPACAALPVADSEGRLTLSLGCAGMRTFTEIAEDRLLAVIPAAALASLEDDLQKAVASNDRMDAIYAAHKAELG